MLIEVGAQWIQFINMGSRVGVYAKVDIVSLGYFFCVHGYKYGKDMVGGGGQK